MGISPKIKSATSYQEYLNNPNWEHLNHYDPISLPMVDGTSATFTLWWKPDLQFYPQPPTSYSDFKYYKSITFTYIFSRYDSQPTSFTIDSAFYLNTYPQAPSTPNITKLDINILILFAVQSLTGSGNSIDLYITDTMLGNDNINTYKVTGNASAIKTKIHILGLFKYKGA